MHTLVQVHIYVHTYVHSQIQHSGNYIPTHVRTYLHVPVHNGGVHCTYFGEYLVFDCLFFLQSVSREPLDLAVVLRFEVIPLVQLVPEGGKHGIQHAREDAWVVLTTVDGVGLARVGYPIAEHETVLSIQEVLCKGKSEMMREWRREGHHHELDTVQCGMKARYKVRNGVLYYRRDIS